jgi:hypothetical protein
MKKALVFLGFLFLLNACSWNEEVQNGYEFDLLDTDSMQLFGAEVESYDPITKNMDFVLLFDANQGYTSFVVKRAMRSDSFKIYYNFDVVDDEVMFKNFRFESATIKRADIQQTGFYTQERPFIKLYLPK